MPTTLSPSERSLRARLAAHTLHSRVDSRAHTAPARKAFLSRFEHQVDPDRTLPSVERARRAQQARKAYFTRLAYQSVRARRKQPHKQSDSPAQAAASSTSPPTRLKEERTHE